MSENLLREPYALFTHRGITHETNHCNVKEDGISFEFEANQTKLRVLDESDEILFQLRDYRDQIGAQENNDNIYGEFKVSMKDLMSTYGEK